MEMIEPKDERKNIRKSRKEGGRRSIKKMEIKNRRGI
jgi:hypothetical protein